MTIIKPEKTPRVAGILLSDQNLQRLLIAGMVRWVWKRACVCVCVRAHLCVTNVAGFFLSGQNLQRILIAGMVRWVWMYVCMCVCVHVCVR